MNQLQLSSIRSPAVAWLFLVLVLGAHVTDEAMNDFLWFYNGAVEFFRDRFAYSPLPNLQFTEWLTALVFVVLVLLLLTAVAHSRGKGMRRAALFFSIFMIANGVGHLTISVFLGFMMPGAWTSPLLILGGSNLFWVAKNQWFIEGGKPPNSMLPS